jgi:hypothetical protein
MSIQAILMFNSALAQIKQNQLDSANIDQQRAKTESMQNELDIQKRTKESGINLLNDQNVLSDYQAKTMIDAYKEQYKHANDHLDALSDAQDLAQHKADMSAQQAAGVAKQLHASDPDVQAHVSNLLYGMNVAQGGNGAPISTSQQPNAASFATPTLQAGQQAQQAKDTPMTSPAPNATAAVAAGNATQNLTGGTPSAASGVIPSIFPMTGKTPQLNTQQTLGLFGSTPNPVTGTAQGMDAQARQGTAQPTQQPINVPPQQQPPQEQAPAEQPTSGVGAQQPRTGIQGVAANLEKQFGMPEGSMWIDPATGKPGMNPFYIKQIDAQIQAQANVQARQPEIDWENKFKTDTEQAKRWDHLMDQTDPEKASSRSSLGKAVIANHAMDEAINILSQPTVTNGDASMALSKLSDDSQRSGNATLYGSVQGIRQFITGKPQDTMPDDIKSHIIGTLHINKATNYRFLKQGLSIEEAKASKDLINSKPEYQTEWEDMKSQILTGAQDNAAPEKPTAKTNGIDWRQFAQ